MRIDKTRVLNCLVNSSIIGTIGTEAITISLSLATTRLAVGSGFGPDFLTRPRPNTGSGFGP